MANRFHYIVTLRLSLLRRGHRRAIEQATQPDTANWLSGWSQPEWRYQRWQQNRLYWPN